jgi:hypothetical protein
MSGLYRLVTQSAPWTAEEKWRVQRPRYTNEDDIAEDNEPDDTTLEKEQPTGPEPDELSIWVASPEGGIDWSDCIGIALRGRWALIGDDRQDVANPASPFWIYKAKDCESPRQPSAICAHTIIVVLPAFWQSKNNNGDDDEAI